MLLFKNQPVRDGGECTACPDGPNPFRIIWPVGDVGEDATLYAAMWNADVPYLHWMKTLALNNGVPARKALTPVAYESVQPGSTYTFVIVRAPPTWRRRPFKQRQHWTDDMFVASFPRGHEKLYECSFRATS